VTFYRILAVLAILFAAKALRADSVFSTLPQVSAGGGAFGDLLGTELADQSLLPPTLY
jgi:hypothetical protein